MSSSAWRLRARASRKVSSISAMRFPFDFSTKPKRSNGGNTSDSPWVIRCRMRGIQFVASASMRWPTTSKLDQVSGPSFSWTHGSGSARRRASRTSGVRRTIALAPSSSSITGVRRGPCASQRLDPEYRMIRRARQRREVAPDLRAPAPEVGLDDARFLLVRNLGRAKAVHAGTPAQLALARDTQVADPLRVSPRRNEIALPPELEHVDGHGPPLAAHPPAHRQGGHDPEPHEQRVHHPAREPSGAEILAVPPHVTFDRAAHFTMVDQP